jgi:hypothetical protein
MHTEAFLTHTFHERPELLSDHQLIQEELPLHGISYKHCTCK